MPNDTFEIDPVKSHGLGRLVNRSALQEGEIFIPVDVTGEDWISLNRNMRTEGYQRLHQNSPLLVLDPTDAFAD